MHSRSSASLMAVAYGVDENEIDSTVAGRHIGLYLSCGIMYRLHVKVVTNEAPEINPNSCTLSCFDLLDDVNVVTREFVEAKQLAN